MPHDFWGAVFFYGSIAAAWIGGEAGRAYVAGAAGGLMRWWMSEHRRLRDGVSAAITGAIFARYLSPVVLVFIEKLSGPLQGGKQDAATFATGLLGMSMAKIIIAALERRVSKFGGSDDNR